MDSKTDRTAPSHRIVVVGGGFGGVYALRALRRLFRNDTRVSICLISDNTCFLFTPLLHEVATGASTPESVAEPLLDIAGGGRVDFVRDRLKLVDLAERTLMLESGQEMKYDSLILALGATTNYFGVPGAEENSFPLKTISDGRNLKNRVLHSFQKAQGISDENERKRLLTFVVVGGGPTGVEYAAELAEMCVALGRKHLGRAFSPGEAAVILLERGPDLLGKFDAQLREIAIRNLTARKVEILTNTEVSEITKDAAILKDGRRIESHTIVWVAGVKPNLPEFSPKMEQDRSGRLPVGVTLEAKEYPGVFLVGDMAAVKDPFGSENYPMLAQVAVRQGALAALNVFNRLHDLPLRSFSFRSPGVLVSLGNWMAAGKIFGLTISGPLAWWIWRTIYLSKLITWKKKMQVAWRWTVNLFLPRDTSEI